MNTSANSNLSPEIPLIGIDAPAQAVEPTFKVGDPVKLKSGGPVMTVARNTGDGRTECCYYCTTNKNFVGSMFWQDMLTASVDTAVAA